MVDRSYRVYVVQGQVERDWSDCQAALDGVPARVTTLPFVADPDVLIARARDADALVDVFSPITRGVMSALEGLKTVVRTGVGYDVIDVPAATELGVIVVNIPDLWVREVANHALALLLTWNRKILTLDRQVRAGVWAGGVPGGAGALHGETVGIVGLGNIGSAFARRVAALETTVIACDPYVDDRHFAALGVERVSLERLAERSDYVSVHTLLNTETRHLIGEKFFARMKPTALRSEDPGVRALFTEDARFQSWLDVEAALAQAQAALGIIPEAAAREIARKAHLKYLDLAAVRAGLAKTGHPLVPLVWALDRACDGDAGGYVHWGATTQ